MSGDPFDDNDGRTVFRPNPGGRRPSPAPTAPDIAAPQAPVARDNWGSPQEREPPPAQAYPRPALLERSLMTLPQKNPIMRAAGPLLLLLGRLRVALMRASFAELMDHAAETIKAFDVEVHKAGVPAAQATAAKYVLCATADDIVQHIPSEDRHVWTQYSMLSRFFGERTGGVRFFQELDKAIADPVANADLLELLHACLALGFQGIQRTASNGQAVLQNTQRRTYEVLKGVKPPTPSELSPRWVGMDLKSRHGRARLPFWAVAAVAVAALSGLYLTYWTLLSGEAEAVASEASGLHPPVDLTLYRKVPAPPPPPPADLPPDAVPTQLQRIRTTLASEIAAGEASAEAVGTHIAIRLANAALFDAGKAEVKSEFLAMTGKLASVLNREAGPIKVIGHTDSTPLRTKRFKSNFELSVARAKAVVDALSPKLSDSTRLVAEGRGQDEPLVPDTTPANKAKNRRVEILIDKVD
ncbi:type IVB secretion system protein IcmH/DotU [Ancylobacter sp. 6x-1]|uniref:Type IVB secretion system protein IcmH/DotU n=1 Tax=Ancylobacter crimeensis TaxID=2579147 RepID=A0ABT0D7L3_9HYPH|nr:type IVB secretion system protein IcmH/DotU [Ancylobacter crimeensis]MCK0195919.1 type IVB secretion system protein IcmH/DotU [Ancylobacter crimeensis]